MAARILVIEDNEQDQKIISRYLTKAGAGEVLIATTGEEGIALARQQKPDIILVDTLLPGIDGFETCRQLKGEFKETVSVVIMTGRVSAVDVNRAKAMGADEYCVKTSNCAELLTTINTVFAKRGAAGLAAGEGKNPSGPVSVSSTGWEEKANQAIKILSHELERKNEELNELDQLKSKFVATVSHELRTPLTIIDGAVSQVASEIYGPVNDEQRKKLEMALRASERLRGMIDELLDFAKLEARKVTLKKEKIDMVEIAREIHASFYPLIHEKGVELVTQCSSPVIALVADRNRVIQILMNLLGNARKFTSTGRINVRVNDFPDRVECTVSDTGRGIAEADLPKVFGRFQQFGESGHAGGTGLGLSIVKELVELHGGTIGVESVVGKGTTFKFVLPKNL